MSRLDTFIARMSAQRLLLDDLCARLNAAGDTLPGPAIELGLGNGRTYDHLREKLTGRRIIAFDRVLNSHPQSIPPDADLVLGDIRETAAAFAAAHGAAAALLHADLGNGKPAYDQAIAAFLPGLAVSLVRPGGYVVTSTEIAHARLALEPRPRAVADGRYHLYRCI